MADREQKKWMIIGGVLGLLFVIIFYTVYFAVGTHTYTPEQKAELNKEYAENCTRCLAQNNLSCTADTLQYSHWGPICENKYIKVCNQTCIKV